MRKGLGVVPSFLSKSLPVNAIHCHRIEREEKDSVQEETVSGNQMCKTEIELHFRNIFAQRNLKNSCLKLREVFRSTYRTKIIYSNIITLNKALCMKQNIVLIFNMIQK